MNGNGKNSRARNLAVLVTYQVVRAKEHQVQPKEKG